ncbi:CubicO group peptidase (beta-lactamase class C family) [Pedobacter cryoconitis]|uniref:CubicO group peptidase (Beta-lactamase class C family) n=1 Tax=Pedobacter cryoconitis TaxID=188932 RepID=A0A7W8ZNA7_9SPHI|nr:serine hydrolase [Pedobacter cryoconitis]MBB5636917.1 CubicO group peptidase (beta-lactamase class C family) [Pedobacter cryoconitis]
MKVIKKSVFTILFLSNLLLFSSGASAQISKAAQIDSLILNANRLGLFNGNMLVADNNKIVFRTAIGFTDTSGKTKLTEQYRFHIGSIAKEFNAVAIMILKEQGKLNLEDPVSKYLPELPLWASKIHILNLLQYTSGVPDVKWKSVKSNTDNMENLRKTERLDFEPGSQYAYNNNNVFLQRRIIEKISGLSFNDFVKQYLLKPCGMKMAIVDPVDTDKLIARAYNNDKIEDTLTYPIDGWVAVTLDDFYKWAKAITEFRLISPASTKQILEASGPDQQAGLGGGSMNGMLVATHKHDGTARNYQALLVSTIAKGRTVILMTNNQQNNLFAFNTSIQAILDGKPYSRIRKSVLKDFGSQLETMNGQEVLTFFEKMKKGHQNEYDFDGENPLNEIGYNFLRKNKFADAVLIFEQNTKLFPESGNAFDSLGEAYYKQGNKNKALLNYKHSLALNPDNADARKIIKSLE